MFRPAFIVTMLFVLPALHAVEFNDATLALLKSPRPTDRQRFFAAMPTLTLEEKAQAVSQLREARDYWRQPIVRLVTQASSGQNAWTSFLKNYSEWKAAINPLLTNIRIDYHKESEKDRRAFEGIRAVREAARARPPRGRPRRKG